MKSAAAAQLRERPEIPTADARRARSTAQEGLRARAEIAGRVRPPVSAVPAGQTEEEARLLGEYNLYNG